MPDKSHDPARAAVDLGSKLAARTRHVSLFLGAGVSKAAGLPDLAGLQGAVLATLEGDDKEQAGSLFEKGNIETALSYLRRLASILEGGQELGGITRDSAIALEGRIATAIIQALGAPTEGPGPFLELGRWLGGAYYRLPVEVFTINYDLLIERGLEGAGVPYFDGFVGNLEARFRPELVDRIEPADQESLPGSFVRLWKLHGSVNWKEVDEGGLRRVVRLGSEAPADSTAAIYPSDEKYDQSRRVPFLVLLDRLRRALSIEESLTIVSGYSFGDQHLNEMFFDAAQRYPRSEIVALCFDSIPEELEARAQVVKNLTVFGATEAIIGGHKGPWQGDEESSGVWDGERFLLGDFGRLVLFLVRAVKAPDPTHG